MADIVRLQDRLDKKTEHFEQLDLTAKMIPLMVRTVDEMKAMGANHEHIIRFLQATIEELRAR